MSNDQPTPELRKTVTRLCRAATSGGHDVDGLVASVMPELHQIAERQMKGESDDKGLQPTALVNEAYLRLVEYDQVDWQGRTHFKAAAAVAMQRVLIDHARKANREKRGGGWRRMTLHDAYAISRGATIDVLDLHDAIEGMRRLDARQADVVELRLFGGMTIEEVADVLGISKRTVDRDWKMGVAWLRRNFREGADE